MDFRDSAAEAAFRTEARAFLEAHAPAALADYWSDDTPHEEVLSQHREWQRTLHAHGWAAPCHSATAEQAAMTFLLAGRFSTVGGKVLMW